MFNSKTLFILGAGTGFDYGLPLGSQLVDQIIKTVCFEYDEWGDRHAKGDAKLFRLIQSGFGERARRLHNAGRRISIGLHSERSIDDFLDRHSEDEDIKLSGKLAIVYLILNSERTSTLYLDNLNEVEGLVSRKSIKDSWLAEFSKMLFANVNKKNMETLFDNVSIVNFNYDRCFERYIVLAIQASFLIDRRDAENLVKRLRIFHPYGTVGKLPSEEQSMGVPFGAGHNAMTDIFTLADGIKTYTEQIEDEILLKSIKDEVSNAETIVFLGFGYHKQNMDLLEPIQKSGQKRVFATALHISDFDCGAVREQILRLCFHEKSTIKRLASQNSTCLQVVNNLNCRALLEHYQRSMTMI